MASDQQLQQKAYDYIQSELVATDNYEDTLRYFYILRESIDQYLTALDSGEDDYGQLS